MTPQTEQMCEVARAYCDLIEQAAVTSPPAGWLSNVATLLPRINAAVADLDTEASSSRSATPDMDARFRLYERLHSLLGELDAYWLEFDVLGDENCKSGSLADDLTDIYCELKSGLEMVGADSASQGARVAAASWRNGFRRHWGRHLLDAQRHLIDLDMME